MQQAARLQTSVTFSLGVECLSGKLFLDLV